MSNSDEAVAELQRRVEALEAKLSELSERSSVKVDDVTCRRLTVIANVNGTDKTVAEIRYENLRAQFVLKGGEGQDTIVISNLVGFPGLNSAFIQVGSDSNTVECVENTLITSQAVQVFHDKGPDYITRYWSAHVGFRHETNEEEMGLFVQGRSDESVGPALKNALDTDID